MPAAIRIENLGKQYIIGHQRRERYIALRDVITHELRGLAQRLRHPLSVNTENTDLEEFWALKDINLEIKEGDCVGIIGRNGAGKSTLLKILSRITEPTTGRVRMRGRVASLLEVGTGFHPELTGRENIYLNGAILGMRRAEITCKFEEIVAFSEVEKFLDTPVKRYSSGMYVRLAFAIAAQLEPEILVVDEVLAVGDAEFQRKCLGKMGQVAKGGRTVLFVSHNMGAIQQLTTSAVLLASGSVAYSGDTAATVGEYLKKREDGGGSIIKHLSTNHPHFTITQFGRPDGSPIPFNQPLEFQMVISAGQRFKNVVCAIGVYNSIGCRLLTAKNILDDLEPGVNVVQMAVSGHRLPPGEYNVSLGLSIGAGGAILYRENLIDVSISEENVEDMLLLPYLAHHRDKIGAFYELSYQIEHTF